MRHADQDQTTVGPGGSGAEAGITLLEVILAMVMIAVGLAAVAGVFGASVKTGVRSKELNRGARFLEQVMAGVDAQSYDALLAMNGNVVYDASTKKESLFRADLSTKTVAVGLAQVVVVLTDQRTEREQARIATFRSQR